MEAEKAKLVIKLKAIRCGCATANYPVPGCPATGVIPVSNSLTSQGSYACTFSEMGWVSS